MVLDLCIPRLKSHPAYVALLGLGELVEMAYAHPHSHGPSGDTAPAAASGAASEHGARGGHRGAKNGHGKRRHRKHPGHLPSTGGHGAAESALHGHPADSHRSGGAHLVHPLLRVVRLLSAYFALPGPRRPIGEAWDAEALKAITDGSPSFPSAPPHAGGASSGPASFARSTGRGGAAGFAADEDEDGLDALLEGLEDTTTPIDVDHLRLLLELLYPQGAPMFGSIALGLGAAASSSDDFDTGSDSASAWRKADSSRTGGSAAGSASMRRGALSEPPRSLSSATELSMHPYFQTPSTMVGRTGDLDAEAAYLTAVQDDWAMYAQRLLQRF